MAPSNPQGLFDCAIRETIIHSPSLFGLSKSVQWIFEMCTCDIIKLQITIIMTTQGHRSSCSRTLCYFVSEKKQKQDFQFFFGQCIVKQLLEQDFVISMIITKVLVRGITRCQPWLFWISHKPHLIIV